MSEVPNFTLIQASMPAATAAGQLHASGWDLMHSLVTSFQAARCLLTRSVPLSPLAAFQKADPQGDPFPRRRRCPCSALRQVPLAHPSHPGLVFSVLQEWVLRDCLLGASQPPPPTPTLATMLWVFRPYPSLMLAPAPSSAPRWIWLQSVRRAGSVRVATWAVKRAAPRAWQPLWPMPWPSPLPGPADTYSVRR